MQSETHRVLHSAPQDFQVHILPRAQTEPKLSWQHTSAGDLRAKLETGSVGREKKVEDFEKGKKCQDEEAGESWR